MAQTKGNKSSKTARCMRPGIRIGAAPWNLKQKNLKQKIKR